MKMRTIRILLWIILGVLSIPCSAQRTFSEVASIKGVTSSYVGKPILRLAGSSMVFSNGKTPLNLSRFINDLTSIEFIQCDDSDVIPKVQKVCDKIMSKYHFEIISQVTGDDESVTISGVFNKNGKDLNMLLINVSTDDELTYILLKGKIDIEALTPDIMSGSNN